MPGLLRHWLSLGLSVLILVPLLVVAAVLAGVLLPQIDDRIDAENRVLSSIIGREIRDRLNLSAVKLAGLAEHIRDFRNNDPRLELALDIQTDSDDAIETLYLLDARRRVVQVGLSKARRSQREGIIGLDFSRRSFVVVDGEGGPFAWSETYLSATGKITVALAIEIEQQLLVGEFDLAQLAGVMTHLGRFGDTLAVVLDHEGRVIAHPEAERGLSQENWSNNPLIHAALNGEQLTGRFKMEGIDFVGTAAAIPDVGWLTLVAQPLEKARATINTVISALMAGLGFALLLALGGALAIARIAARRLNEFSGQMRAVARGRYDLPLPSYGIHEFNDVAASMRAMGHAVLERERQLTSSEARFRDMAMVSADWIWEVDIDARYIYTSDGVQSLLGLFPGEILGRTPFDLMPPNVAAKAKAAFADLVAKQVAVREINNIYLTKDGQVRHTLTSATPITNGHGEIRGFRGVDRDVTEWRRNESQLRLAASVFESSAEGIFITDANKRIISGNPATTEITGYAPEEIIGKKPSVFSSGRHGPGFYADLWQSVRETGIWRGEIWNRRKSGEVYPEWLTITAAHDPQGAVTHYIGMFFDISERKKAEERIHFLAYHDSLTLLPNRQLLQDRMQQAIVQARRNEERVAILFLDLDQFKLVNDTQGHQVGDRLLEEVARRLTEVLRETETVARMGGDEFVIVMPDSGDFEQISVVAAKILTAVGAPVAIENQVMTVTPSVGISIFPDDGDSDEILLRNADTAMYHAKAKGRNNFQFFDSSMNVAVQERVSLENDLRLALERNELVLFYQPQVNCRTGALVGAEALIRWRHPERGLVSPASFIPIAEETGLILPIGEWVLREACRQTKLWHEAGHTQIRIGVNLSPRQFAQPDLYNRVAQALADSGLAPAALEIELTEGMLVEDPDMAAALLHQLAGLGIGLAIDDFGTGYSSLSYLKRYPLNRLKIDQSFIRDLAHDPNDAAIVDAVIALANALKMEVIAEGVETEEQLRFLLAQGCEDIQGYYFGRPCPASEFSTFQFKTPF
jgi:diguanylate cyclase (GGDEF)-like protein/PAS domain S-box-containing protein